MAVFKIRTCRGTGSRRPWVRLRGAAASGKTYHCLELDVFRCHFATVDADVCALISGEVAVVGRAEDGDASAVVGDLISLLLHFMRTNQQSCIITELLSLFSSRNFFVMFSPNPIEAPRLLGLLPMVGVGSAHKRSHIAPFSGGSMKR